MPQRTANRTRELVVLAVRVVVAALRAPHHKFLRKSLASVAHVSTVVISKENELNVRSLFTRLEKGEAQ